MGTRCDKLLQKLNEAAIDFEIGFFEKVVSREPDHIDALMVLGNHYTLRGECAKGLRIDLRLTDLLPRDPIVRYNLACSYSLLGNVDEAIAALEAAISLGYRDFEFLLRDRDLDPIREDARFKRLVERGARV
jgi:tetratricopeptide (TPR) repeat protein